jgi:hypothetical protein
MKSTIFWDITPCSPLKVNRRFGGTSSACYLFSVRYLARLLRPSRWRRYVPPKRRLTLNGLHGVISHKTVQFITKDGMTSNPTDVPLPRGRDHTVLPWAVVSGTGRKQCTYSVASVTAFENSTGNLTTAFLLLTPPASSRIPLQSYKLSFGFLG